MKILVFGSINMDVVAKTPRLPAAGETLAGDHFFTSAGGKGANQAVAVARLGGSVQMVGRVGNDAFGQELLTGLQSAGVHTGTITIDPDTHTGTAVIAVDSAGNNTIIYIAGANGRVDSTDIERLQPLFASANTLLLQLELPLPVVLAAAQAAKAAGIRVILDPAPTPADFPEALYPLIDIITPNEVEVAQLTGIAVNSPETAAQAAAQLCRRGVATSVIKLGAKGVFCANGRDTFFTPAFPVVAVDTVAAGDAFNGAFALALSKGFSLREAVKWGAAAGALAATKAGAGASMPDWETFSTFLQAH
jgi:ribokinase